MNGARASGDLLADRAYAGVRDRILSLELAPGSVIDEEILMTALGVGRTPIREAIKRLAFEDLVVIYPRQGTFVSDIHITDLGHISELRRPLEAFGALKAAQAAPSRRQAVRELLEVLDGDAADTAALMEIDRRVHHLLYDLSGNPFLAGTARQLYNLSVRIWYLVLPRLPHLDETVGEHRALLEAVKRGDAEQASELAARHVSNFADTIRAAL